MDGGGSDPDGGETTLCEDDSDCSDALFCNGLERCAPTAEEAGANGCLPGSSPCDATEICNEIDQACRVDCPTEPDADGDGHNTIACGGDDCDDADANRYPGNIEVCDGQAHDEDCNPDTFGFLDADGDGSGSLLCCNVLGDGTLGCGSDCNDADSSVNPRAGDGPPLYCDGINNDCDEVADEGCACMEGGERECGSDAQLNRIGACRPGVQLCLAAEWTTTCADSVAPSEEICDGIDNDCDGVTDEAVLRTYYRDVDGDGFGVPGETTQACSPPAGWTPDNRDCDDAVPSTNPLATEVCNGADDDCDMQTDEGVTTLFHRDFDGDGFGDISMTMEACARPTGYVVDATDCDDMVRGVNPPAAEICDGIDNNCDSTTDDGCSCTNGATMACGDSDVGECVRGTQRCVGGIWGDCVGSVASRAEVCNGLDDDCDGTPDDGVTSTFYLDSDGDGFGDLSTTIAACDVPPGYSRSATDCDDSAPAVNPAAVERCNGFDDNCAGGSDEGCSCTDGTTQPCGTPDGSGGFLTTGECTEGVQQCLSDTWGACVGAVAPRPESCNGLDDDCADGIDEGTTANCYPDGDGDGYGTGAIRAVCAAGGGGCPTGFSALAGDCNDGLGGVNPGASETCNGLDDDCSGSADDGGSMICVQGTSRSGTGAFGTCGSIAGTYFCDAGCGTETFIATPPNESCNGSDDNCNGVADEGFVCAQGSTGNVCVTGCGSVGTYTCSGSCTPGTCTGAEVCNGCDDDSSGGPDDTFTCALGETQSCTAGCGTGPDAPGGTQTCLGDCSGFGSCAAPEVCNGCDDDQDTYIDEGFGCAAGTVRSCTTACNTPGQQLCSNSCSYTTCAAPGEYCNYCDDNGFGNAPGWSDERSLATDTRSGRFRWANLPFGGTCIIFGGGVHGDADCQITQTVLASGPSDNGAAELLTQTIGWGPIEIYGEVDVRNDGASRPLYGWSVVMYRDTGTFLGSPNNGLGVNPSRVGFAGEWRFFTGNVTVEPDEIQFRPLNGSGSFQNSLATTTSVFPDLDMGDAGTERMAMRLRLWADDPHTPANEMHVELHRVTASSGSAFLVGECDGSACGATLQIGDQVQMGVASTTQSTYYAHIEIPMEEPAGCSNNCTTNSVATAEQVCPGTF